MKKTLLFALALAVIPVGVDAQDTNREVGDWRVREIVDPFDDSPQTMILLAAEDATSFSRGIRLFVIRCGIGGPGLLSLYVGHSFMGGDDGNVRMTYRLGDAEAKTVTGRLTADNDGTVFNGLNAPEVTALLSSPRVAVRIVDLLDGETRTENWTDLEGTAEAVGFLHCLQALAEVPPPTDDGASEVAVLTDSAAQVADALTTVAANPVDDLPPPPTDDGGTDLSAAPVFTPMTVRPEILNRGEVLEALMRLYPPILRDAGIGGTVEVWFFISEDGTVIDQRVSEPSVHAQLNEAALEVAEVFKFSPALNRETIVQVWIRLPITFEVQN